LRPHAISERRGKLNGLLTDFGNRDGLNKVAEAARAKIEDDLRSVTTGVDDRSILRAMESST
jgi:hypothetical protein